MSGIGLAIEPKSSMIQLLSCAVLCCESFPFVADGEKERGKEML